MRISSASATKATELLLPRTDGWGSSIEIGSETDDRSATKGSELADQRVEQIECGELVVGDAGDRTRAAEVESASLPNTEHRLRSVFSGSASRLYNHCTA